MKKLLKKEKGITLIALVITIILLLILAGVTIKLVLDGGLIEKSQTSVDEYSEEYARERLELELVNMIGERVTNDKYNENDFLTEKLTSVGFGVSDNNVIVDGWQFEIDRSVPKIVNSKGRVIKNESIELALSKETSIDYTKSTVTVKITYNGELEEIIINGEKIEPIPEAIDGVYTIIQEVTENKTVGALVKDKNGNYNMSNIKISEITEDMDIRNLAELKEFRDKVNEGRTFAGRKVNLLSDIDVNPGKYTIAEDGTITFETDAESWIPIGNYSANTNYYFAGTFEGNNHKISGLYINNSANYQGLFGVNTGTINGIIIDKGTIYGNAYVASIVGSNSGKVYKCRNNANISSSGNVGGICGANGSRIERCINWGNVSTSYGEAGGITAGSHNGTIYQCGNYGNVCVTAYNATTGSSGISNGTGANLVEQCFNKGYISGYANNASGNSNVSGIGGAWGTSKIISCYNTGNIYGRCNQIAGISSSSHQANSITISGCYNKGTISRWKA